MSKKLFSQTTMGKLPHFFIALTYLYLYLPTTQAKEPVHFWLIQADFLGI